MRDYRRPGLQATSSEGHFSSANEAPDCIVRLFFSFRFDFIGLFLLFAGLDGPISLDDEVSPGYEREIG